MKKINKIMPFNVLLLDNIKLNKKKKNNNNNNNSNNNNNNSNKKIYQMEKLQNTINNSNNNSNNKINRNSRYINNYKIPSNNQNNRTPATGDLLKPNAANDEGDNNNHNNAQGLAFKRIFLWTDDENPARKYIAWFHMDATEQRFKFSQFS